VSGHVKLPRNRPCAQRGTPLRDIRSDWRRWSVAERLSAAAIMVSWLGTVSSLLIISAG
jgi:hypothetical protein